MNYCCRVLVYVQEQTRLEPIGVEGVAEALVESVSSSYEENICRRTRIVKRILTCPAVRSSSR
jgi:hypothetical protein